MENSTGEDDLSDLADRIEELKAHPLNINKASADELSQFPFLSEKQIANLINYRELYGELYSAYEIRAIEGFDSLAMEKMLPFIRILREEVNKKIRMKDLFPEGRVQFLIRCQQILQRQQGYSDQDSVLQNDPEERYIGSPQKYYFRFRYDYYDRISAGIAGEKDAGEGFFSGSQPYGMDFYAGYIELKNTGFLKNLIIGNFNADFGQGLTLSSRLSLGALPSSGNLRRFGGGLRPSLSANETRYLRGIAATIKLRDISGSLFFSRHKRDASVISVDSLSGDAEDFRRFEETGYHRLPGEVAHKNAITEVIYGGNINYRNNFFRIGLTGFHSRWNAAYTPVVKPYNQFSFSGRSNLNLGMDFQFIFRTFYGFGEIARSMSGGMAWLAGIQVNPDPDIKFSLICRDYQRNYQDLLSNAIGQNENNSNEKGLVLNFSSRINSRLGFYTYLDIYAFPWLKYRTDFISYGREFSGQLDYTPVKSVLMFLRYRIKCGQINEAADLPLRSWINIRTESIRYQSNWKISPYADLNNRFEVVRNSREGQAPEYGYLISQDVIYKPKKFPVNVSFRYALFNTGSYETRIYTYETDVLYGYSAPALEGSGIRFFLMISAKPWKQLEIWARYSHTYYSDRKEIGTGPDKINGNNKSELKIQVLLRI